MGGTIRRRERYHTDPEYRQKRLESHRRYQEKHRPEINQRNKLRYRLRFLNDPVFSENNPSTIRYRTAHPEVTFRDIGGICNMLARHHEQLRDDPEHLTTDFLKKLLKVDCDDLP